MRYKKCLFLALLVIGSLSGPLNAQGEEKPIQGFTLFTFENALPESLLSGTTAVFVSTPGQWKELSGRAHIRFRKLGIDAVAYYNAATIRAGSHVAQAFAGDLLARGIHNIILLEQTAGQCTLIITTLSQGNPFFTQGQKAWKAQSNDVETVLASLTRAVSTSGLTVSNHLILEVPEFFYTTRTYMGKRFEDFNSDLKIDKLAVPIFEEVAVPDQDTTGEGNKAVLQAMRSHNSEVAENNRKLEAIFRNIYPFASEPVQYSNGETALREKAYQFVLLRMHAPEKSIRRLLGYDMKERQKKQGGLQETGGVSPDRPVYKYYIKHLASGEVYLGTTWDAAPTWDAALKNYISNMKDALNITK